MTTFPPCTPLRAAHDSGPRRPVWIKHVVIHSAEATSARGVAQFFATPTTKASTQLAVDGKTCYRCVPDLVIPWGAPGVNKSGLHVELCGFAKWTRDQWLRGTMLERAAFKCAVWAWTYRIPTRWLTLEQLRQGNTGFCTHADATNAFHTPGGHHDPGAGFPKAAFMQLVRDNFAAVKAERTR